MSPKILTINILIFRLVSNEAEVSDSVSYGSITDVHRTSQPVTSGGARTRKYSESVGRSYVASAVARSVLFSILITIKYVLRVFIKILCPRSMSVARPSGFAASGIGVGSGRRGGEDEQLIA